VAELIETQEELFEQEEQPQETQAEQTQEEVVQEESPLEVVEDDIPPKYRGKTAAEIARMHMEAEKLIGRQAQEVGEVRKLADELIKRQLDAKQQEVTATKEDEIDFFEDPSKAVSKAVEKHPAIQEAKQQALQLKQMQIVTQLKENFPDFQETVQDPAFAEWVKGSPVRLRLYAQADGEYDYDAAAELLTSWRYVKGSTAVKAEAPTEEIKAAQKAAVKAATVDVGSNSTSPTSNKVYRRADLIRLQMTSPDRYYDPAFQEELLQAYATGRVK
jgi:hypothetical protein